MNLVPKIVFFGNLHPLEAHCHFFLPFSQNFDSEGLKTKTKVSFASRSSQEGPGSIPDLMSQSNFHPS